MASVEQALETQLSNIEKKTGKARSALTAEIETSGKAKHGEIRDWLKAEYGLGHGDANTLAHFAMRGGTFATADAAKGGDAVLDGIYKDRKAALRPVHEKLMAAIGQFGVFEIAPKQGYVSLRRKKQFAMLGPKTNDRFELGLNLKDEIGHSRVKKLPPGGMCQYIVPLGSADEVDAEIVAFVKRAYDAAG